MTLILTVILYEDLLMLLILFIDATILRASLRAVTETHIVIVLPILVMGQVIIFLVRVQNAATRDGRAHLILIQLDFINFRCL